MGFIYHKASSGEDDEEQEVEMEEEKEEDEQEEEEQQEENEVTEVKGDDEALQLEMVSGEEDSVEDIKYQCELRRLANAIRKLQAARGEPMDKKDIYLKLIKAEWLREFIVSPREIRLRSLKPHPQDAELQKTIARHKAKRDQYLRAGQELDTQLASYRVQTGSTLQLREELEDLLPLLPGEQQLALTQPSFCDPEFTGKFEQRRSILDSIAQVCSVKLNEIEENLVQAKQLYKQDTTNDETPRTLFKAFKCQS